MCHCGQPTKAKNLCAKHYLASYRERKEQGLIHKTPLIEVIEGTYSTAPDCGVKDCGQPIRAKHLCTKHYFQLRRAE